MGQQSELKQTVFELQPLYKRLHSEISKKVEQEGLPARTSNDTLRSVLRTIIQDRRVPRAVSTLTAVFSYLGYTTEDPFFQNYVRLAQTLSDRQIFIVIISKDAATLYFDLHDYKLRLAPDDTAELFAKAFGEHEAVINGILNSHKEDILKLDEASFSESILNILCNELTLKEEIDAQRKAKIGLFKILSDNILSAIKKNHDGTMTSLAERIGVSRSALQNAVTNPYKTRTSIENCQEILNKIEALGQPVSLPVETCDEPSHTEATEVLLQSINAEDIAYTAISIVQSGARMFEAAGKEFVFPHELQIKALNAAQLLKRIALQGKREDEVVEGRPLTTEAMHSLSGRN